MALPFENMTVEELAKDRLERFKSRETWEKDTQQQKMHLQMASQLQSAKEALENMVLKIKPAEVVMATKDEQLALARQEIQKIEEAYMHMEVYAVYGNKVAEELYGKPKMSGKLPEEMEKKLDKLLKETKEAKRPKIESAAKQSQQAVNNMPNWGWGMPNMGYFPTGGGMAMPNFGFGGYQQQMAPAVAAPPKQAGGVPVKKRYPCDNCGSVDHWKSNPVCPNFHLFLQLQAAKAEEIRKGSTPATPAAATGGAQATTGNGSGGIFYYFCKHRYQVV